MLNRKQRQKVPFSALGDFLKDISWGLIARNASRPWLLVGYCYTGLCVDRYYLYLSLSL